MFFQDLKDDPQSYFDQVTRFLGVSDFVPEGLNERSNSARTVRVKWLGRTMTNVLNYIQRKNLYWLIPLLKRIGVIAIFQFIQKHIMTKPDNNKVVLSEELRAELLEYYKSDTEEMEKLTARDLTHWKI